MRPRDRGTELEATICQSHRVRGMVHDRGRRGSWAQPALQMLGIEHSVWVMAAWSTAVAFLGVFFVGRPADHFVVRQRGHAAVPVGHGDGGDHQERCSRTREGRRPAPLVSPAVAASAVVVAAWAFPHTP